jgi:hypothetical protein
VVITGDLNLPDINWDDPNLTIDHDKCSVLFVAFTKQQVFEQYVEDFTRPSSLSCAGYEGFTN